MTRKDGPVGNLNIYAAFLIFLLAFGFVYWDIFKETDGHGAVPLPAPTEQR